jgi:hypothetical protein
MIDWVHSRMVAFLQVLHAPELAFARDLRGPSYLVPLIILGLLFTLISVAQSPIHIQWTRHQLESAGAAPEQIAASMDLLRRSSAWSFVGVPLFLLLRWVLYALLLWLVAQVVIDILNFQQALTIVAFSYLPILLRDAAASLVLFLRSEEALLHADGLNVSLGLNLLLPAMPLPWSSLAGNVNLFEAWFVFLLVVGIAQVTRSHWRKALAVVLPSWLFVALVQFGLVSLGLALQKL